MKPGILFSTVLLFLSTTMNAQRNKNLHTFLGVDVNSLSQKTNGLYVNGVYKGYGAEKAGLQHGDTLRSINSTIVHSFGELVNTLDKYSPGEKVEISFIRNNSVQNTSAILSEYPEFLKYNLPKFLQEGEEKEIRRAKLGVTVEPVWEDYAVMVTDFTSSSAAAKAGIKQGDVILKMDNYEFATIEELSYYLSKYKPGDTVSLLVKRDGEKKSVQVVLGEEIIHINRMKDKEKQKDKEKIKS